MRSSQIKVFFYSLILFASLVLILGIFRGESSIMSYFDLLSTKKALTLRVNQLKQENLDLSMEIKKIQESPMYAKKVLKDRYHTLNDNESLIFLPD